MTDFTSHNNLLLQTGNNRWLWLLRTPTHYLLPQQQCFFFTQLMAQLGQVQSESSSFPFKPCSPAAGEAYTAMAFPQGAGEQQQPHQLPLLPSLSICAF